MLQEFALPVEDFIHFSEVFAKNLRMFARDIPRYATLNDAKRRTKLAVSFTHLLEDMGPTFVKFGQLASTRADFFPEDLTHALERLQDRARPFPSEKARQTVEEELGPKFKRHFKEFNEKPVACGSLAQVHSAILKSGEKVAMKILRPNIERRVSRDLVLIRRISRFLERTVLINSRIKPSQMIEAIGDELQRHCDFTFEIKNAQQFRKNFNGDRRIVFPKPVTSLSTPRVLTMECVDGVKLSHFRKVNGNPETLARIGMDAVFKMVFVDGFVHGDMHPGNIFALPDSRAAFLDLGLVARVTPAMKQNLLGLVKAIVIKDKSGIAKYLFIMGEGKKHSVDYDAFEKTVYDTLSSHFDKPLGELRMEKLLREFFSLLYQFRLTLHPDYALLFCTLISIEGSAKKLFPQANLFSYARDFLAIAGFSPAA